MSGQYNDDEAIAFFTKESKAGNVYLSGKAKVDIPAGTWLSAFKRDGKNNGPVLVALTSGQSQGGGGQQQAAPVDDGVPF